MECFGSGVNRMVCGVGDGLVLIGLGWVMVIGVGDVKLGLGWVAIGRLCVVCATTQTCCKCNNFIQIHAPG